VPRRVLFASLAAAVLVVACGDGGGAPTTSPDVAETPPTETTAPPTPDPDPDPTPDPTPEPPPVTPPPAPAVPAGYELVAGETGPESKLAATAFVEALTTYEADDGLEEVVARATDDDGLAAALLEDAAPLHHEGAWSRGRIVYPQLGGLEPRSTAVITVVRQEVGHPDGTTEVQTRVLDVRVDARSDGSWHVTELVSAGGDPVPRPDDLSEAATAVLDDDRIELPDTARWDIHRGAIDESLLELMGRIAERTPYGVVVLDTGHSREVFGTDRISRHAEGRAVDLYRIGDTLVIEDREVGSPTHELVRWLYDQPELSEVGSPWALDRFGGRSFSDELHQDHLHIGVLRPGEAQRSSPPA
jgi:hypothetical protein